jgi:hypothetical protein
MLRMSLLNLLLVIALAISSQSAFAGEEATVVFGVD